MGRLSDRKFENYATLQSALIDATDAIHRQFKTLNEIKGVMKSSINEFRWQSVRDPLIKATKHKMPGNGKSIVSVDSNGFFIAQMIAPESRDEEDPIVDNLRITCIEDVFWAKRIVQNAFYDLISSEKGSGGETDS